MICWMIFWVTPALAASAVFRDDTAAAWALLAPSFLAFFLARTPGTVGGASLL